MDGTVAMLVTLVVPIVVVVVSVVVLVSVVVWCGGVLSCVCACVCVHVLPTAPLPYIAEFADSSPVCFWGLLMPSPQSTAVADRCLQGLLVSIRWVC